MMEATLVFPHQLFSNHPASDKSRPLYLLEDALLFGTDPAWPLDFHVQKRIFHRATMRAYEALFKRRDYEVHYLDCEGGVGTRARLNRALPQGLEVLHLCEPHDQVLLRRVREFADERGVRLELYPSPAFMSPLDWLDQQLDKKKPFMATFYKAQRRRMNILMKADGEPEGGQWSFDEDNRKKLPKGHACPVDPQAPRREVIAEAREYVTEHFPDSPGKAEAFPWPVTHHDARDWLDDFLKRRLGLFGDYEDALHCDERVLYHSQLSPLLNVGLLTPQEVVDRTLAYAESNEVPINSLEGFLRQIIGWREFIHGIYRQFGVRERHGNFWNFNKSLPRAFYEGSTGIPPVDEVIRRVQHHAYSHHIERLMVIGAFMLLCRIHPDAVYRWFMELHIDAYDWVMVPNIYGMSQFADGGLFSTKPYLCGSNYIRKMSNFPKGDWCDIWDGLYWSFIADYQEVFAGNHRMAMMARNVDRMDQDKLSAHRRTARNFLDSLS